MSERIYNFSAGPATLPESVIKAAQSSLWTLGGSGIGIMEHSHRSPEFSEVIENAEARCRKLANISEDYAVLFLQGGASSQFFMAPQNFLGKDQTADYVNTGAWSKKAIKEAKLFGNIHVPATSEDKNFSYIPSADQLNFSAAPRYVHITSNNTIAGTQWAQEPEIPAGADLFCDASSDIFCRPIDVSKYGLVYAGAQKNLGPAGVTLAMVKKSLVDAAPTDLPTMLQYRTHVEKGSRFNTPPTFGIYVISEVFDWLLSLGGLEGIEKINREKSSMLYSFLDESKVFTPLAARDSRSMMNITFRAQNQDLEPTFISEAKAQGLGGLKGHRSVGGMRASIYNAMPIEGVTKLVEFMKQFETANR